MCFLWQGEGAGVRAVSPLFNGIWRALQFQTGVSTRVSVDFALPATSAFAAYTNTMKGVSTRVSVDFALPDREFSPICSSNLNIKHFSADKT